jgi:polyisoprenoid-binding protein YceI
MKKIKIIAFSTTVLAGIIVISGFTRNTSSSKETETILSERVEQKQTINLFVTYGHCSTPFAGELDRLTVDFGTLREDGGNPVENMKMSFVVDPNSFNVCAGEELTKKIKTPGLFMNKNEDRIIFESTNVYTMGMDWYQVNGKLSIKGVEKDVKFFVTGIRDKDQNRPKSMVLEGQFNLLDWGIDYDKIVNGKSDTIPTKWMHINMKFGLC